jgi:hypothetical protein
MFTGRGTLQNGDFSQIHASLPPDIASLISSSRHALLYDII